ncbi:hypothetical protein ACFW04_001682 [Cataglyphis niger]
MKEDSLLSFKWQSFPSHLVVSLDTCYEKQQFVDLSLVCKDNTILKCHKMVLANASSFFRRLIMANDHPHPMIVLHDVEADDLKTLVNFMYCGEIQIVQSEVRRLLKLAETLEVTGLRHIPLSILSGEGANNTAKEQCDTSKKTATVSRLKIEETRSSSSKGISSEHEINTKAQSKVPMQPKLIPKINPQKTPIKVPHDTTKKKEEININELCQRLENSNSGISIVDINDMPSTSKGLPNISNILHKRKESSDPVISWPRVLSTISNDKLLPFKKLRCIMDEIEITPSGKSSIPVLDNKQNEPLDRRKVKKSSNEDHSMNTIYIKDEIDISSDLEEDVDMDPLEVDDNDNENSESSKTSTQQFFPEILFHSLNKNACSHTEFSTRKDSNS